MGSFFVAPVAFPPQSDVFLAHDWSADPDGRKNHKRASRINMELKKRGFTTWFDDKRSSNNRNNITEGINSTRCVVVFITPHYCEKVNNMDDSTNCYYEFNHALEKLGSEKLIPVVLAKSVLNPQTWGGNVGAALTSNDCVDMTEESDSMITAACDILELQIMNIIGTKLNDTNSAGDADGGNGAAAANDVEANVESSETFDAEEMPPRGKSVLHVSDVTAV